jgi:hypothetical protein
MNKARDKLPKFDYSPVYMAECLSMERLGGQCGINLCSNGETLLTPDITSIIDALLTNGHFVFVVTNGTISKCFDEIIKLSHEKLERLFFKFSFHYLELLRIGMMENFILNVNKIKTAGCSFSIELTPYDELIPHIDEIKQFCINKFGALCHVTVARDTSHGSYPILSKLSFDDYKKTWSTFNSAMFDYKMSVYNIKQHKFCYAGVTSAILNLATGDLTQCYQGDQIQNIYKNSKKPIRWYPIGKNCLLPYCYNAHAFLTLGTIPELNSITPTYSDMRNKICIDGSEWLTPTMKNMMQQKLTKIKTYNLQRMKNKLKKIIKSILKYLGINYRRNINE